MKKQSTLKRALALGMSATMVGVTLAGCGGSASSTAATSTETASSATTEAEATTDSNKPFAGTTLTWYTTLNGNVSDNFANLGDTHGPSMWRSRPASSSNSSTRRRGPKPRNSPLCWPPVSIPTSLNIHGRLILAVRVQPSMMASLFRWMTIWQMLQICPKSCRNILKSVR